MFWKCQNDLYKSLDDVSGRVFRTHWEIYDGAFFKKINNAWKPRFPQKSSINMFDRVLNTPLVSNLVFSLLGHYVEQNYWRGMRPYYKGFRDTHWKDKKNFLFGRSGDKYFLHLLARKTEALFFLAVDKISKLCPTSESSKRSPVFNLERHWMDGGFWKVFHRRSSSK